MSESPLPKKRARVSSDHSSASSLPSSAPCTSTASRPSVMRPLPSSKTTTSPHSTHVHGEHTPTPCSSYRTSTPSAVNIARLVDDSTLLCPALYRCTVLGSAVLDGWTRNDGVVEHFAPADLRMCMDAHAALARESVEIFAATFEDTPHADCKSTKECRAGLHALEDVMLREEFWGHRDVFDWEGAKTDIAERAEAHGVCDLRQKMLEDRRNKMQWDGWKRLSRLLGIEVEVLASDSDEDEEDD